tara:strand:- start:241 stop:1173 length:933 start_codon:yes stop_codon:yes gene_type:complete
MKRCEDLKHTAAAHVAKIAQIAPVDVPQANPKNLDSIIKLYNKNYNIELVERPSDINKINYLSDHNGILNNITYGDFEFNLISFNLEGLCRTLNDPNEDQTNEFHRRLELMELHFSNYDLSGSIIAFQELALQIYQDNLPEQINFVNYNLGKVVNKLGQIMKNNNFDSKSDNYTSGIVWDKNNWNKESEIEINREESSKFSNAYLFKNKHNNLQLYIVNVHLKADANIEFHINELYNIIREVHRYNKNFEIPVYFMGDFNNDTDKKDLFNAALNKFIVENLVELNELYEQHKTISLAGYLQEGYYIPEER